MNDVTATLGLRQHDGVGRRRHDGIEIGVDEAGCQPVDARDQTRAPVLLHGVPEKIRSAPARVALALRHDRIFEIDDDRVGAARHRLVELPAAIGGNE